MFPLHYNLLRPPRNVVPRGLRRCCVGHDSFHLISCVNVRESVVLYILKEGVYGAGHIRLSVLC